MDLGWPVHPLNFVTFIVDISYLMDCGAITEQFKILQTISPLVKEN